jgi:hypothetical protein
MRTSAADRVFLDCRGAGILVRRAHRTGRVGAPAGMPCCRRGSRTDSGTAGLLAGARRPRAIGGRTPAGLIQRPGLWLAAGPPNAGAAARCVRTLPAVTLSDTGDQGERAHCRRSGRLGRPVGMPSLRARMGDLRACLHHRRRPLALDRSVVHGSAPSAPQAP